MAKTCKMDIEKGTLYFGIYSILQAVGAIIISIIALTYNLHLFSAVLSPWKPPSSEMDIKIEGIELFSPKGIDLSVKAFYDRVGPPTLLSFAIVSLLISVLLVLGIVKRKPGFIQAFFIYGVIITPLTFALNLFYIIILFNRKESIGVLIFGGILHVIYIAGLVLTHKVYKKMKRRGGLSIKCDSVVIGSTRVLVDNQEDPLKDSPHEIKF